MLRPRWRTADSCAARTASWSQRAHGWLQGTRFFVRHIQWPTRNPILLVRSWLRRSAVPTAVKGDAYMQDLAVLATWRRSGSLQTPLRIFSSALDIRKSIHGACMAMRMLLAVKALRCKVYPFDVPIRMLTPTPTNRSVDTKRWSVCVWVDALQQRRCGGVCRTVQLQLTIGYRRTRSL